MRAVHNILVYLFLASLSYLQVILHTITGYLLMTVKKKLLIIANVPFENTLDTGSDLCGA